MAYIGKAPINGFHAKQQLTGDGSTVTFTLDQTVATETSIIVSVGGVLQEPAVGFNLATGGTQITFTEAPSSTDRVYVQFLGTAIVQNLLDVNGAEFVLDANGNTSFTADTDDEIDIKVGGTDRSTIKATGFHNVDSVKFVAGTGDDLQLYHDGSNSYLANSTGALKIATETSGIAITLGHTTSEVTVADNMTVTGNLTIGGTTNFGDFNITNVGSIALDTITNDGTDITLDSSGDIILDSDGADVIFKDAGTEISRFTNSSSDFIIQTAVSDKDFIIKGNDGGATITPFTIDMSAGGDLFLTGGLIDLKNDGSAVSQIKFYCESSNAHAQTLIGAPHSESATNTLTLPSTGGNSYLVTAASTATLTNKTLTSPVINTGTFGTSILPTSADGTTLGSASKEFSDLFLADAGTIQFGNDQDVTLTHVADTGLLLNTTMVVQFRDSAINIGSPADGDLDINADDEIELNSTLIDINGNVEISGTLAQVGVATFTARDIHSGGITIANAGQIGSVGDADAIAIASDGVVTMTQIPVFSAGLNVSGGTIAGTLSTAAQGNITSLGTLTALTVDDVAIDGKVVTMTGSTDDTAVFTVATNGALTLETTDTAAAAANIQITADGTFEVDATTITLDSAGDIVLDAGGNDFNFKAGGTEVLRITNSSSDVVIKPTVDTKDIIFQQFDGTEVARIEDNATFNVVTGKLAINGTAITSTAAELNLLDGVSGLVQADLTKLAAVDATAAELNYSDLATLGTTAASKVFTADANNLTAISGAVVLTEDTLSFDATQDWDVRASPVAKVTLTANVTFDAPSNPTTGQYISIVCIQDGTGSRTIAWNAVFEFKDDTAPTATTTASKGDIFTFRYNGSKWLEVGRNLNLTLS